MPIGSGTAVSVPIRLEVLRNSVSEIEKVLGNLKPESKAFKDLQKIITDTRREMDRLQTQTSKPFGSQQQFNQAEKSVDKIDDALEQARLTISRISFDDLKLSPDQIQQLKAFDDKIDSLRQSVIDFKNEMKGNLLEDADFSKFLESIDPQYASKTFDEIVAMVESKTKAVERALSTSNANIERYQRQAELGTRIEGAQTRARGKKTPMEQMEAALGANNADKFFTKDKNDILRFKGGQKEPFVEYLTELFTLTPDQVDKLRAKAQESASAVLKLLFTENEENPKENFFAPQLAQAARANKKLIPAKIEQGSLVQQTNELNQANEKLRTSSEQVAEKEQEVGQEMRKVAGDADTYQQSLARDAKTHEEYTHELATGRTEVDAFRQALEKTNVAFIQQERQVATFNSIKSAITNFMGFNQVLNLTRRAVSEAANHIKQLDTVMNGIAIVTDMTTADLWQQVDTYSKIAQNYGTSIQGAYEVSKIYYQAGYETVDVMTLTNETLKLSTISGLDYATTTDYMMTAMRGFKLEMEDASRVVDVYSNLAANTAVSQQELAEAMTRTASSMESVGATFEETSSMIATMVAVTRESANNIGSAMKSIAARYGELTKNPTGFEDLEGEAYSFNKVDEALQSVGISMKDADGQFRSFTEVILELTDRWDSLTSVQQRYIATQFAGNRQQSRFLALVSNGDLLRENLQNALNSEDVGTLQALEYLDSLEAKINQVQVAYQQFYTTIGIEEAWKSALGFVRQFIDSLNSLPKVFGKIPINAANAIYTVVSLAKNSLLGLLAQLASQFRAILEQMEAVAAQKGRDIGETLGKETNDAANREFNQLPNALKDTGKWKRNIEMVGQAFVTLGLAIDKSSEPARVFSGILTGLGGVAQIISGFAMGWAGIPQIISGVLNVINGISLGIESAEERIERLTKEAETLNNVAKQTKAEERTLDTGIKKLKELETKRYDSAEAERAYQDAVNELADSFPNLIHGLNESGEAIILVNEAELALVKAREKTAEATFAAATAERKKKQEELNNNEAELAEMMGNLEGLLVDHKTIENVASAFGENLSKSVEQGSKLSDLPITQRFVAFTSILGNAAYEALSSSSSTKRKAKEELSGVPEILAKYNMEEYYDESLSIRQLINKLHNIIPEGEADKLFSELEELDNAIADTIYGELPEHLKSIAKFIYNYDPKLFKTEEGQKQIEEFYAALTQLSDAEVQVLEKYNLPIGDIKTKIQENIELREALANDAETEIQNWILLQEQEDAALKVLADQSNASSLLIKYLSSVRANYTGAVQDFFYSDTYQSAVDAFLEFYNGLDQTGQELLNNFNITDTNIKVKNALGIAEDDFISPIIDQLFTNVSEQLNRILSAVGIKDITERDSLSNNLQFLLESVVDRWQQDLTPAITDFLIQQLHHVQALEEKGLQDAANIYTMAIGMLFNSATQNDKLFSILINGDFTTKAGVNEIIKAVESSELPQEVKKSTVEDLNSLKATIIENVLLSIRGALDEISTDVEADSKLISKASSGLSYKELNEFITAASNWGVDLKYSDFNQDATGKWVLSVEKILGLEQQYQKYIEGRTSEAEQAYQEAHNAINGITIQEGTKIDITQDFLAFLDSFQILTNKAYVQNGELTKEGAAYVNQQLSTIDDAYIELREAAATSAAYIFSSTLWNAGQYGIENLDQYMSNRLLIDDATTKAAVEKATGALNTFYSDLLAKGFDSLNFFDYENIGIPQDVLEELKSRESLTALEFLNNYGDRLGKSAEELADMYIKAMESEESAAKTIGGLGASSRGSRINFANVTTKLGTVLSGSLNKILTDYGASLENGILTINADADIAGIIAVIQTYAAQAGIDLTTEMATLADTTTEVIRSYTSLIQKGMTGKLTNVEAEQLQGFAQRNGFDLSFKKTADGLKISNNNALQLIQSLRVMDSLQANLAFDEYVKTIAATSQEYSNISTTMAEIARLKREIEKSSGDEKKQLEQQLALARKIAATMTADASQFSFMDRALPGDMSNPINYWNAWGKAFTSINEAKSKGYMAISDFYNIVNELTTMAIQTGNTMTFMGHTIEADGSGAAELMQTGLSALSNVDGKGVQISLKALGTSFDIGAADMAKGLEAGIHTFAESQVKMLDAEIALLEVVVAMENLELGEDGILSFDDLFIDAGNGAYKAQEQFANLAKSILNLDDTGVQEALKNFTVNINGAETSLADLFTSAMNGEQLSAAASNAVTNLLIQLNKAIQEGDWDGTTAGLEKIIADTVTNLSLDNDWNLQMGVTGPSDTAIQSAVDDAQTAIDRASETTADDKNITEDLNQIEKDLILNPQLADNVPEAAQDFIFNDTITRQLALEWVNVDDVEQRMAALEKLLITKDMPYIHQGITNTSSPAEKPLPGTVTNDYTVEDQMAATEAAMLSIDRGTKELSTDTENVVKNQLEILKLYNDYILSQEGLFDIGYHKIEEPLQTDTTQEAPQLHSPIIDSTTATNAEEVAEATEQTALNAKTYNTNLEAANDTNQELETSTSNIKQSTDAVEANIQRLLGELGIVINESGQVSVDFSKMTTASQSTRDALLEQIQLLQQLSGEAEKYQALMMTPGVFNPGTPQIGVRSNGTQYIRGSKAKGNVALAAGRTLMGELGPELYVSGGHYYVAGRNGAEFVNLPKDAIVFNHLQTQRLLSTGTTSHGTPVTNEHNAISYATGNVSGPALASASATLATLKQIRAMWQAMLDASLKDLGQQAGGGGGGGKEKNTIDPGFVAELERWYNLLRQIDKLEKEINYEENLRNKIQSDRVINGAAYYESQKRTLDMLDQEIAKNKELASLQKDYYDRRREDLANSQYGKIFTFNENGLMQYADNATMANGDRGGLLALAKINAQNSDNSPVYTAREQYELLKAWGFGDEELKYNSSGELIKWVDENGKPREAAYTESVEAFWDKVDAWKEELDSLYDSYNDQLNNVLTNEDKRNQLLQEIIDNQLSVEKQVLEAIEEREQAIIDELQKERDALKDATDAYVNGLSEQLDNERKMYENQQEDNDLKRLRRQLAILQRSGGSASQISSLQNDIASRERDAYFDAQQQQIDAIKEASDLEIERLDAQLDLMKDTLEYEKKNGLFWPEVIEIMSGTPESIMNFIATNKPEYQSNSELQIAEDLRTLKGEVEQWVAYREDKDNPVSADATHNWDNYTKSVQQKYSRVWNDETAAKARAAFDAEYARSADPNRAGAAADAVFEKELQAYFARHPEQDPKNRNKIALNGSGGNGASGGGAGGGSGSGSGGGTKTSTKPAEGKLKVVHHYGTKTVNDPIKTLPVGTVVKGSAYAKAQNGYIFNYSTPAQDTIRANFTSVLNIYYRYRMDNRGTTMTQYASGGLNNYTGLAMLHGTKARPEAVLNAEETRMLREDIMSGKSNSLMSLLMDFRSTLSNTIGAKDYKTMNNNDSVSIGAINLTMQATLANDYDAQRAVDTAYDRILEIARKTGAQSIRR